MTFISILVAILVFAVLVIVHEFGHFIVAKRAGVRVDEFAVGFPPRIWSIQRGETRYSLNALPLGGYVLMPGENGIVTDEEGVADPRSFAVQTAGKRAAIMVAGVTMNMFLAFIIYMGIFGTVGTPVAVEQSTPTVGQVAVGSPAQAGGLQAGDTFISFDGTPVHNPVDVNTAVTKLLKADTTTATTVPLTVIVNRHGVPTTLTINARKVPPKGEGPMGAIYQNQYHHYSTLELPGMALHTIFIGNFQAVGEGFHQILTGVIKPADAFTGPVGIVRITSMATSAVGTDGLTPIFTIMAFLSWNLAVFNLLPIPGLDGGRLFLLFIEVLRRGRRLAPEREALINLAGLGFLLSLILIITINDVIHIFNGQ